MIVFRVEHNDGYGPYISFAGARERLPQIQQLADKLGAKHNRWDDDKHPTAKVIPGYNGGGYVCGFTSLAQLKRWFNGFQNKLRKAGYKIALYEVEEFRYDSYQCIFEIANAKLIGKIPMRANTRKYICI